MYTPQTRLYDSSHLRAASVERVYNLSRSVGPSQPPQGSSVDVHGVAKELMAVDKPATVPTKPYRFGRLQGAYSTVP